MALTFGSLFAGIGGFDLGFERAGMVCKWQVEIDDYATRVLEKHWPNVHRERDIRECGAHKLESVDLICGGFPCQDISYAGAGAGLAGERSGLFFEALRVVRELQPRIVVLENVAALLTRGLDRVCGSLAEIGFDAEWHCIPAAAIGAPHIRDRVFVYAYSQSEPSQPINDETRRGQACVFTNPPNAIRWTDSEATPSPRSTHSEQSRGEIGRRTPRANWWSTEPELDRVVHGFPAEMDRLRGLGNAVVPQVAEWIGRQIVEAAK